MNLELKPLILAGIVVIALFVLGMGLAFRKEFKEIVSREGVMVEISSNISK